MDMARLSGIPQVKATRIALGLVALVIAMQARWLLAADGALQGAAAAQKLEGIWMPAEVPPPTRGGPPPEDSGGPRVELSNSVLQCAPLQRAMVGGGGMSMLLIQGADEIVMVSEFDMDIGRKIYMNARHPAHLVPQPNGHSVGHWDGHALLVDSIGFADKDGHDRHLHVIERITRDGDVLHDEITSDDGGEPRRQTLRYTSRPDIQFNEDVCEEGFDRYQIVNGKLDNPNIPPERSKP